MSSKKEGNKNEDYRKNKKINKAKIRDGQKNKNFLIHEDSILNTLPSGAFDKNESEKEMYENKKVENDELKLDKNINNNDNILVDEEEYEEFDSSYFEPVVYKK